MAKILIVDDEALLARTLELLLRMGRHSKAIAQNGAEGLALLAREPFDLVLVDAFMPTMTGEALAQAIRADVRTKRVPVVAVTGLAMAQDHARLLAAGANLVIPKPFDPRDFLDAIARILRQTAA